MEGAGSPAEINLMDVDIVNMSAAKLAGAPVLLVGDIDKGGVFASLYGTVKLLGRDGRRIKGYLINKFRGDLDILKPGLDMIEAATGRPVIGVLPYVADLGLPEEDSLALRNGTTTGGTARSGSWWCGSATSPTSPISTPSSASRTCSFSIPSAPRTSRTPTW